MAAAHATLKHLNKSGLNCSGRYERRRVRTQLNDYFTSIACPSGADFSSIFFYDFHLIKYAGLLFYYLRDRGIIYGKVASARSVRPNYRGGLD